MSSKDNSSVRCLKWVRMTSHRSREIEWRGSNVRHPRSSIADRSHLIVNRSLAPVPSRRCIPCVSSKWFSTLFLNQCHRSHYRYTAKNVDSSHTPFSLVSLYFFHSCPGSNDRRKAEFINRREWFANKDD